ncbi:YdcH family protein [Sandarakinorhabdus oryzae]|uniref:YdcH family protein n=1 Tax=Sandarakinorhabdus oryzae TaxID=2675220 RepID=UPI0012E1C848|nr:YdcH family protein [Sandarakinorhabdus oryzae]
MANAHRDQLLARHARIDANLAAELKRPLPDPTTLRRLKREKLKLKDAIVQGSQHH